MFNKRKVLYSAMAVALMSGGGNAWSAGLTLTGMNSGAASGEVTVATEDVDTSTAMPKAGSFSVSYQTGASITDNFNVIFTLSGGATWGTDLGSSTLECSNSAGCTDGSSGSASISLVDGGEMDKDSTAMFLVTGKADSGAVLSFSFSVTDKAGALASSGGDIQISVALQTPFGSFPLETSVSGKSVKLIKSADGLAVSFVPEIAGSSKIDVSQGTTQFISSSGVNSARASLGKIKVAEASGVYTKTLVAPAWSFTPSLTVTGNLVVSTAPFNASVTGGSGKVFIDVSGDGLYDEGDGDLLAEEVTDTDATWSVDSDAMDTLVSNCENGCKIIIEADGSTQIQAQSEAPLATANIVVASKSRSNSGKLLHIKRNGSVCTLYNIPNTAAADQLSVRITNMGSNEGVVLGTLRGLDGKEIFSNQTVVEALAPNATTRIDAAALKTLAGGTDWSGRAVLTLSSTIPEGSMEVYGLVRNNLGGPLMNLSSGASGNGCDN